MRYPDTRRDDLVEQLHGHAVPDPYRWLEDAESAEVHAWVETQREFGEAYLAELPAREWFRATMRRILARPRAGCPRRLGPYWFVTRNDGTQNQDVWYVADTVAELETGGRVFVDPNAWSADGTSSLAHVAVSDDGRHVLLSRSDAGSDWHRVTIHRYPDLEQVGEELLTKFSSPTWLPDNRSFLIHRYPDTGTGTGSDTQALTPADLVVADLDGGTEVLWANPGEAMLFTHAEPSHDGRWLIGEQGWGTERANAVFAYPLRIEAGRSRWGERIDVVGERVDQVTVVRVDGDELIALTDAAAPRRRVVRLAIAPGATPREIIAEGPDPMVDVFAAGEHLIVQRLVDVTPQFARYDLAGTELDRIGIEGGSCVDRFGRADEPMAAVAMSSVTQPARAFLLDSTDGAVRVPHLVRGVADYAAPDVATERLRARSADGTQVPYWRVRRDDLPAGSPVPTLVYGYGGFTIPIEADYRPGWSAWLAAGGAVVICNLRGGSEFGTAWYDAGRREHKQHVFDDVIGVAEDLLARGLAAPGQLAVYGRSNGGLLAGAALTQRPDLWGCALPQVGVLDLLRFHHFTGGAAWISDYGDPEDAADFAVALAYSPLHRIRDGVAYPPTLIATGDHDDRVVPLHSHKFTAALQHAQAGEAPIVERIEVATGHGVGKPTAMVADEWADLLAFAAHHTGLRVP